MTFQKVLTKVGSYSVTTGGYMVMCQQHLFSNQIMKSNTTYATTKGTFLKHKSNHLQLTESRISL